MTTTMNFGHREWQLAYRVALRVLKTPDQAEDAAQEALMNAYAARHTFEGRSRPDSWLYRIAHNAALSHLRNPFKRRYASTDVHEAIDDRRDDVGAASGHASPERTAIANQLAGHLGTCLEELRPKDRLAFTERFLLGTSERELGEMLGVTTNAAKQRAFRARRAVRTYITEAGISPA